MNKKYDKTMTSEWPEDCTQGGVKWSVQKRREYLAHLIETIGLYLINKTEVAKKTGAARQHIYLDLNYMYKHGLDRFAAKRAKINIAGTHKLLYKKLTAKLVQASTMKDISQGSHALVDVIDSETKFLEAFGVKRPVEIPVTDKITVVWKKKEDK